MSATDIEDIFPLTLMQRAVLFHSLRNRDDDPGMLQVRVLLTGPLDTELFHAAWREVVARHQGLRSSAHWEDLDEPMQVVSHCMDLPWAVIDRRQHQCGDITGEIEEVLRKDRKLGLGLNRAPVLRGTVVRFSEDRTLFVLTCHHLFLDGWSGAVILEEAVEFYDALLSGNEVMLEAPGRFSDFGTWLRQRDRKAESDFWRDYLRDLRPPPRRLLDSGRVQGSTTASGAANLVVDLRSEACEELLGAIRKQAVATATLVQALWTVVLNSCCGGHDVVFATTVSGRHVPLPDIETTVGMFTNVVPFRASVSTAGSFFEWMRSLQQSQDDARPFSHVSIAQIRDSGAESGASFHLESLVVVENYPTRGLVGRRTSSGLKIESVEGGFTSAYPVTLLCSTAEGLRFQLTYGPGRMSALKADRLMRAVRAVLDGIADGSIQTVDDALRLASTGFEGLTDRAAPPKEKFDIRQVDLLSPIQTALVQIWQDALDIESITVKDDFFDLGGSSLAAMEIFSKIELVTGIKLPLTTLIETPTIEALAERITGDGWPSKWKSLVPIQRGRAQRALFCLHGVLGTFYSRHYRDLARLIGPEQPFLGLQTANHHSVEDMAAHYIEEMREFQPEGPYTLVGNCTGGLIALEMSRQLAEAGQKVDLLALIDTAHPAQIAERTTESSWPWFFWLWRFPRRALFHIVNKDFRMLRSRLLSVLGRRTEPSMEVMHSELVQQIARAAKEYRCDGVVPWDLLFFLASATEGPARCRNADDVRSLWGQCTSGSCDVVDLACSHDEILVDPNIAVVAENLRERLAQPGRSKERG